MRFYLKMNANYEYFFVEQAVGSLDVDDIGNCCISANNDLCEFYYLIVKTDYGVTKIIEYGPYVDMMTPSFQTCSFQQFQYSEQKIDKIIAKFLNNPKRNITQAMIVEFEDIEDKLINPVDLLLIGE